MFTKSIHRSLLVAALVVVCFAGSALAGPTAVDRSGLQPAGNLIVYYLFPSQINFTAYIGSSTASQSLAITYTSYPQGAERQWTVDCNAGWITPSAWSGTGSDGVTISVNSEALEPGSYSGTVTVTDPQAFSSPQSIPVNLRVIGVGGDEPPFGEFDTPQDNSTVSGGIPVTGWALDDSGVESVKIYRGQADNLIYIGDAVFVDGARPDMATAYPDYPNQTKAGWGYMMLTNFLPNGGNGTYTLWAKATDGGGRETTLGSKTITVDNASAVKPFGAIDTPTQGGLASGSQFLNSGWVLTPLPYSMPPCGGTINVYVDGAFAGNPAYSQYREDIAAMFPGYANSQGAGGYFYLDTTGYADGVHTIQWTAMDSGDRTDGIGSRYFTIQNTSGGESRRPDPQANPAAESRQQPTPIRSDSADGDVSVIATQAEPLVIDLVALLNEENRTGMTYRGFQRIGESWTGLPVGSTLSSTEGRFYWSPGPAFHGDYELVFSMVDDFVEWNRRSVTVTVE